MNNHTATPNVATILILDAQKILQSHSERMELFHSSKNRKMVKVKY